MVRIRIVCAIYVETCKIDSSGVICGNARRVFWDNIPVASLVHYWLYRWIACGRTDEDIDKERGSHGASDCHIESSSWLRTSHRLFLAYTFDIVIPSIVYAKFLFVRKTNLTASHIHSEFVTGKGEIRALRLRRRRLEYLRGIIGQDEFTMYSRRKDRKPQVL